MPVENKRKKNRFRFSWGRPAFLLFLALSLSLSPLSARPAAAWDAIPAAAYKRMLDTIYDRIQGAILAALKQAAAKTINDLVGKLASGGSGGSPKFITDWQKYLVDQPKQNASSYMNDYLSKITGGMASSNFASSEGFSLSNGSSNSYASTLVSMAKAATSGASSSTPQLTYTADPSSMFDSGNLQNFNSFLTGINNPWSFGINAQGAWQGKLAEQKEIAKTKSVAYNGYIGSGEKNGSGSIKTPGINIKDIVSNAQDLGNKILAAASHPEEVIASIVTQFVTKAIEQGIGNIQSAISQAITTGSTSGLSGSALTSTVTSAASGAVSSTVNSLLK